jgi:hypothetical protein
VEPWEPTDDLTLIMEVLQRIEANLGEIGDHVVRVRSLLEEEDGEEEEENHSEP